HVGGAGDRGCCRRARECQKTCRRISEPRYARRDSPRRPCASAGAASASREGDSGLSTFKGRSTMKRCRVFSLFAILVGLVLLPGRAVAQQKSYPEKPITLLVPYAADGASDQVARALAEAEKKHLRQPIVVANRPGESGTRAIAEALGATPDGYTLGWGTEGTLTVQPHRINLPYGAPDTY